MHDQSEPNRSEHDPDSFSLLVSDAKNGCEEALGRLLNQCRPYLLAIANAEIDSEIAPKVGASDVVQNSILSAQRCISDFEGDDRQQLLAWLRGILIHDIQRTRRHFQTAKRKIARERPLFHDSFVIDRSDLAIPDESPSKVVADRELEQQLARAIKGLSPDEQRVIDFRNWQRLSFVEIGSRMERSDEAARKLWSRAIVKLQRLMGSDDD